LLVLAGQHAVHADSTPGEPDMTHISFGGLFVVAVIALVAPLLVSLVPKARIPADVVAIVAGIIVGPSVLDWVRIDTPITVQSLLGLAFLLFLAGLELDLDRLRGPLLGLAGTGFLISVAIGVIAGWVFHAVGYVQSPFLLAVALSATSLGLVVPILKDAGQLEKDLGQFAVAGSSVAEFGATLLLSFFFSGGSSNSSTKVVLIAGLAVLADGGRRRRWLPPGWSRQRCRGSRSSRAVGWWSGPSLGWVATAG
jgi:Kef-type K+ transport system membrane component KefB